MNRVYKPWKLRSAVRALFLPSTREEQQPSEEKHEWSDRQKKVEHFLFSEQIHTRLCQRLRQADERPKLSGGGHETGSVQT
jgi:hypothetical protein